MAKKAFGGKETAAEERAEKKSGKEFGCGGKVKMAGGGAPPQAIAALLAARQKAGGAPKRPGPTGLPSMGGAPGAGPTGLPMGGAPGMKKGGKVHKKKYAKGGAVESMGPRNESEDVEKGSDTNKKFGEHSDQKRGRTRGKEEGIGGKHEPIEGGGKKKGGAVKKYAKGGFVKSADGIARRGHTKTKHC